MKNVDVTMSLLKNVDVSNTSVKALIHMYNVAKIEVYLLLQNGRNFNLYVVFAKKFVSQ